MTFTTITKSYNSKILISLVVVLSWTISSDVGFEINRLSDVDFTSILVVSSAITSLTNCFFNVVVSILSPFFKFSMGLSSISSIDNGESSTNDSELSANDSELSSYDSELSSYDSDLSSYDSES